MVRRKAGIAPMQMELCARLLPGAGRGVCSQGRMCKWRISNLKAFERETRMGFEPPPWAEPPDSGRGKLEHTHFSMICLCKEIHSSSWFKCSSLPKSHSLPSTCSLTPLSFYCHLFSTNFGHSGLLSSNFIS